MKCPLLSAGIIASSQGEIEPATDCLKTECAWYVEACDNCAVEVIPVVISGLADIVEELVREGRRPRATFTCHDCGVRVTLEADAELKTPYDWQYLSGVDGKNNWFCASCIEYKR